MEVTLQGLYVPLVTPFTDDAGLAPDALEKLGHTVIDAGAAGLVALGTTGEPATLTAAERRLVVDVCARVCRERGATLIVGAGSNDTAGTARALQDLAAWPEVSAALTVVPYYTRPSQDGIIAHFTRLAADSPVPIVVYNIPYRTGTPLSWQTLSELARVPGIVGVKHAAGGIDQDTVLLMADLPGDFAVLAGDDVFVSPLLALGATGGAQGMIPSPAVRLPLLPARPEKVRAALSLLGQAASWKTRPSVYRSPERITDTPCRTGAADQPRAERTGRSRVVNTSP
jgi:4-hydroxy-tetrahydrodipicolinate synthase